MGRKKLEISDEERKKKINERARAKYAKPENKKKQSERAKKYNNSLEGKAKRKEYQEKNKEKIKKNRIKYYNSSQAKAKLNEYKEKNKEILTVKRRIYRKNHLEEDAKRTREYRKRYPERFKQSLRQSYTKHKEKRNKETKKEYLSLKSETFEKYSNNKIPSCKICLESNLAFLTLDHIRGRKAEGHSTKFSGDKLWRHLRRNEFPSGYQILCWNCNVLKYRNESITYSNNYKARWAREKSIKQKKQVLSNYSNGNIVCKCCGFDNILALGLDHIKGKKAHGHSKRMTSTRLYNYLIKEKFPSGYQVFCYNCNGGKGQKSACPHELDKVRTYYEIKEIKN